jgi:pimeloyl-ACP methyl ester carboxylesterase
MTERIVQANGVPLCTEAFGDPAAPAVLLIMGVGASMLWWPEEFCELLAGRARYVIRYDHRDTGRSITYEPGHPGYTGGDLVADAADVLDAYDIGRAHIVGVSAGGAFAQLLAIDFADRVHTLVLISTSPAMALNRQLPPPTSEFVEFASTVSIDWTDAESVIENQIAYSRLLAGGHREFDEAAARRLVRRDIERATNFSALKNHDAIADDGRSRPPLSSITAPTLVIHGTADPMFPVAHGEALADAIPNATLLTLDHAGHGIHEADWPAIAEAIIVHTERNRSSH